jgi:hypothetical protein
MSETAIQDANAGLAYACLTHVPLWIEFPSYVTPIYSGQAQGNGRLNLRDLAPEWEPYHAVLGGSAGAFAFKNYLLKHRPEVRQVGICQYRKFISRERIGTQAANYQVMDVLSKGQLAALPLAQLMLPGSEGFLIGQPGQFSMNGINFDYLYQYKDVHHVEDLLRFTAEAVELGVLDKSEVLAFFQETVFFPGGVELGFFPADFWIDAITALEKVVRACVHRFPTRREGVQARIWAFCMERLGSYLLIRRLRSQVNDVHWTQRHRGQLNLITENESIDYIPGA